MFWACKLSNSPILLGTSILVSGRETHVCTIYPWVQISWIRSFVVTFVLKQSGCLPSLALSKHESGHPEAGILLSHCSVYILQTYYMISVQTWDMSLQGLALRYHGKMYCDSYNVLSTFMRQPMHLTLVNHYLKLNNRQFSF